MSIKYCLNSESRAKTFQKANLKFLVKTPTVNSGPIFPPFTAVAF